MEELSWMTLLTIREETPLLRLTINLGVVVSEKFVDGMEFRVDGRDSDVNQASKRGRTSIFLFMKSGC